MPRCSLMNNINFDLEKNRQNYLNISEKNKIKCTMEKRKLLARSLTNMIALSLGDDLFPGSSKKKIRCLQFVLLLVVLLCLLFCMLVLWFVLRAPATRAEPPKNKKYQQQITNANQCHLSLQSIHALGLYIILYYILHGRQRAEIFFFISLCKYVWSMV